MSGPVTSTRHGSNPSNNMTEFTLLYRGGHSRPSSPEETQKIYQKWSAWFEDLKKRNALVAVGHPLEREKLVVQADKSVSDGPFAEAKDVIGGYSIVRAASLEEAAELAKGCPLLDRGGHVEVRQNMPLKM